MAVVGGRARCLPTGELRQASDSGGRAPPYRIPVGIHTVGERLTGLPLNFTAQTEH